MKTVFALLCISAMVYTVTSSCHSCKYGTSETQCTDPFTPSGSEQDICNTLNKALCQKYHGGYAIYCRTGGSFHSCTQTGTTCSGSDAHKLTPGLILILAALGVLGFNQH